MATFTRWHNLFAKFNEVMLSPLDIHVQSEFPIMLEPPRGDVLLLRRLDERWTEAQLRYLPDCIRDTTAKNILIEFKATESLNADNVRRAASYDDFYRASQKLSTDDVLTVIISSKKPQRKTLERFQFNATMQSGIYRSANVLAERVWLISLNELSDAPHNTFIQFFASQKKQRERARERIQEDKSDAIPPMLTEMLSHVWRQHSMEPEMEKFLTLEEMLADGREFLNLIIASTPAKQMVSHYDPEEILSQYEPAIIEAYLKSIKNQKKKENSEEQSD